jgi:hypothetical protein
MFDKPMNFLNWLMILSKCFLKGVVMCFVQKFIFVIKDNMNKIHIFLNSRCTNIKPISHMFKTKPMNLHNTTTRIVLISSCGFTRLKHSNFKMEIALRLNYWKHQKTLYNASVFSILHL